ncbi:MAG TPA: desulfoferrodoxin [Phycisphaerae bacterium]|nr:desulfoferrodoxin [Phycisphaerae bacterium]
MTEKLQVYKCEVCGIVAEVLDGGAGEMVCCGQPMQRLPEKTEDSTKEKHVPYIERIDGGVKVRVGQNAAHPMEAKHWIQWIELLADGKAYRQFLNPGDAPEAVFPVTGEDLSARELCNIHGLWKG